jgi:hypothetical protein
MKRRDGGVVLVQFALMFVALMGIAAMTVDLALASLSQQEMQAASDGAALEGMRKRDDPANPAGDDTARRVAASRSVSWAFDDDLDPSDGDALQFGAGPVLVVAGGVPGSNALATLTFGDPPVYKPVLAVNAANELSGDLVAGTFDPAQDPVESDDYSRDDFVPAPVATASSADSFLVRLRRTNDLLGLDNVADVSSSGPPLPFLFGLGSSIHQDPGSSYNPRADGLTVRATSIATARAALQVGIAQTALDPSGTGIGVGLFPFGVDPTGAPVTLAVSLAYWNSITAGTSFDADVVQNIDPLLPGRQGALDATAPAVQSGVGHLLPAATTVGAIVHPETDLPPPAASFLPSGTRGFVPIFATVGDGTTRVVGFGLVQVSGTSLHVTVAKFAASIATWNATAIAPAALAALDGVAGLATAQASVSAPLLAPVLAR